MYLSRTARNFNIQWTPYQSQPTVATERELGFPFGFDDTGATRSLESEQDRLKSRVASLLLTGTGERRMRPTYGTDIRKLAFRGMNLDELQILIATDMNIRQAVKTYAPEITSLRILAKTSDPLEGVIHLEFYVSGSGPDLAIHRSEVTLG